MDDQMVEQETLDTAPVEENLNPQDNTDEELEDIDNDALKKAHDLANNYKIRAEKAERLLKQKQIKPDSVEVHQENLNLSPKDFLALTENKVSVDDFDEVVRLSKVLGKTISETLKDKTTKIIMENRAEERASAQAANTNSSRRSSRTELNDDVLEKFEKGIVSEKLSDVQKLVEAQIARKKAALKK